MQRYIIQKNIERFQRLLEEAPEESERRTLTAMLTDAQAELSGLADHYDTQELRSNRAFMYIANHALQDAVNAHGASYADFQLYDRNHERLELIAHRNLSTDFLAYFEHVKPGDGTACSRCMETRVSCIVHDVKQDRSLEPHLLVFKRLGISSICSTPLFHQDSSLMGVLSLHFESKEGARGLNVASLEKSARSLARDLGGYLV